MGQAQLDQALRPTAWAQNFTPPRNLRAEDAASVNVAPANRQVCLYLEEARQYLPDVRSCIPQLEQTPAWERCEAVTVHDLVQAAQMLRFASLHHKRKVRLPELRKAEAPGELC